MTEAPAAFAARPLGEVLALLASRAPTPGAGPAAAWTCGLAAALVEMVSLIELEKQPAQAHLAQRRRDRARDLRDRSVALAEADARAYGNVLATLQRRKEPGHGRRLRAALSEASDPPLRIAALGAELATLAAEATVAARGGATGEAVAAAVLAEAGVRASASLVEMNLAGMPNDPRQAQLKDLRERAALDLASATRVSTPQ